MWLTGIKELPIPAAKCDRVGVQGLANKQSAPACSLSAQLPLRFTTTPCHTFLYPCAHRRCLACRTSFSVLTSFAPKSHNSSCTSRCHAPSTIARSSNSSQCGPDSLLDPPKTRDRQPAASLGRHRAVLPRRHPPVHPPHREGLPEQAP